MKILHNLHLLSYIILVTFISMNNATASNKHIDASMKLFKGMDIYGAASNIIKNINDNSTLNSVDKLKYSLIISRNLSIYRDIYAKSIETQKTFLESVQENKSEQESKLAPLYLAEIYILLNKYEEASSQLETFIKNAKSSDNYLSNIQVYRAWIASASGDKKRFNKIIDSLKDPSPITQMGIDVVNIITNGKSSIDLSIIRSAEKEYVQDNQITSSRFANYAIRIYSHRNEIGKAKGILRRLDQRAPSITEEVTPFKLINFYEPSLIDSISTFYYQLSKSLLKELEKNKKYRDMAIYYLSDLEIITANKGSAKYYKEEMLSLKRLPKSLIPLTPIRQNAHSYLYGKTSRAYQAWELAVKNVKNNPSHGSEAVLMCVYLNANCPTIVRSARLKAENGRSKKFESLNTNVGRYFLLKKENDKAMRLLDNALDKGNAQGILMNDPMLLLNLAEVYRLNKRFSESLQIYFSLGKNFPILRQVQDSVQGEYLFRQRSSGSNNVF